MNIIVTNKYRDLIYSTNIEILKELNGVYKVSQIANSFNSIFYKKIIIDATAIQDFPKESVLKELAKTFDMDKLILFLPPDNPPPKKFLSFLVSLNIYNFTDNIRGLSELVQRSNTIENVKEYSKTENVEQNIVKDEKEDDLYSNNGRIVLGITNIEKNTYSAKFIYMLKTELESLGKRVLVLEVDKKNFAFYRAEDMISITNNQLNNRLNDSFGYDIVLIDSDNTLENVCNDVIYLLDPSLWEVNKLIFFDRMIFQKLKGKKIIFVNSLLSDQEVDQFAKEANISVYYNIPPLNDRKNNKKGLFDFFK